MDLLEFLIATLRLGLAGFLVWGGLLCAIQIGWIRIPPIEDASAAQGDEAKSDDGLLKAP